MATMVEKVAETVAARIRETILPGAHFGGDDPAYDRDGDKLVTKLGLRVDGTVDLIALTRLVVEAMREPTEAMLQAGFDLPGLPIEPRETRMDEMMDRGDWMGRAPRSFTAMIDAALAEE